MQAAKDPEQFTQDEAEDYNKRFQDALRLSRILDPEDNSTPNASASGGSGPGYGKRNKQSRLSDLPPGDHPNDLRRIQEDQEFEAALEESRKEEMLRRGGGGTNLPPDNMVRNEGKTESSLMRNVVRQVSKT